MTAKSDAAEQPASAPAPSPAAASKTPTTAKTATSGTGSRSAAVGTSKAPASPGTSPTAGAAGKAPAKASANAAPALTNAQVIKMAKAGVDEDNIIATIRDATAVQFDLSPDGLVDLASNGVKGKIVNAMRERARRASAQ